MKKSKQQVVKSTFAVIVFCAAAAVSACETAPPSTTLPQLTYENVTPLELTVGSVEIVNDYRPNPQANHVDHLFPTQPVVAMENMLKNRLKPVGTTSAGQMFGGERDKLVVTIKDASVIGQETDRRKGVQGVFYQEAEQRLVASAVVRMDLVPAIGSPNNEAFLEVKVDRTGYVQEGLSPVERDRIYLRLTETLIDDLKVAIDGMLASRMSNVVIWKY